MFQPNSELWSLLSDLSNSWAHKWTYLNKGVDVFLVNIFSIWLLNNPTFKCLIGENAAL